MALSAGVASVNSLAEDGLVDRAPVAPDKTTTAMKNLQPPISHSEHLPMTNVSGDDLHHDGGGIAIRHQRMDRFSVTGAQLDLQWRQLFNVEYLTDGGNSWIHTAVFNGKPVVVKTLKPECQDVAVAINEIEGELAVHSRLNHLNICALIGAGTTSKGVRFVVLERLDGGTLTQMLGYDTRIRDRRRRFWRKKQFSFFDIIRISKSIAEAMMYCHEEAIPGSVVMHRDLKPDNIGKSIACWSAFSWCRRDSAVG
jgi:serine/threonine protein kinase